jgi:hypothetical protein
LKTGPDLDTCFHTESHATPLEYAGDLLVEWIPQSVMTLAVAAKFLDLPAWIGAWTHDQI